MKAISQKKIASRSVARTQQSTTVPNNLHFNLVNDREYTRWRAQKLAYYPATAQDILVAINDFNAVSETEVNQIRACLDKFNMVIYSLNEPRHVNAIELCQFTQGFGLTRIDGNLCSGELNVSTVTVTEHEGKKTYIPYTNKAIRWHTDGYYNAADQTIRSFVLHCNQSALSGGENVFIDPELIYILLRDENPDYITALIQHDVLTIPENSENGVMVRTRQSGPVFSFNSVTGKMQMRYTARTRSIEWLQAPIVQQAVRAIESILRSNSQYSFKYTLQTGQGLLCNNVLHNRSAFEDQVPSDTNNETPIMKRELLRARYYDAIIF